MDRYYGSCITVMNLMKNGLYARCTTKTNVRHFPKAITYRKKETGQFGRGAYRFASSTQYGMVAFSWIDGNSVNILTTADGSSIGSVTRQIGQQKYKVQSPIAVQQYNKNMDAVDRWDQKLGKYALHRRHKFKRYYRNIMLVIIDFAILQAELHYNLVNSIDNGKKKRVTWYETLADELINTDWENVVRSFQSRNEVFQGANLQSPEDNLRTLHNIGACMTPMSKNCDNRRNCQECEPIAASTIYRSVDGRCCQICKFEGRGRKLSNVNYCLKHKVRCCSNSHEDHTISNIFKDTPTYEDLTCTDWSWMCQNRMWTCWEKYHRHYHGTGIFRLPHNLSGTNKSVSLNQKHELVIRRNKENTLEAKRNAKKLSKMSLKQRYEIEISSIGMLKGRKTMDDDLANDQSKDNYTNIIKYEADRINAKEEREK